MSEAARMNRRTVTSTYTRRTEKGKANSPASLEWSVKVEESCAQVSRGAKADTVQRIHIQSLCRRPAISVGLTKAFYRKKDRKSTRLNSSHLVISYAVFCMKKKNLIMFLIY